MAFNYKKIGSLISEVDVRNSKSSVENLIGVTIDKVFIPSVANTNGTDLSKYKIIRKNQFACSLMQVSRDGGVAISMYKSDTPSIMSPAYFIFEVNTPDVLPEYLELVLYNPEFDREATFNAVGGVRGTLTWEDFCNLEIHIPTVSEQEKIVNQYNAIINRIDVLERLNAKLEDMSSLIFDNFIKTKVITDGILSDVGEFIRGKNITAAEMIQGDIPVISAGLEPAGYHNQHNVKGPSITISASGVNAGHFSIHFEDIWAADCSYNNASKHICFLYETLKTLVPEIEKLKEGHTAQPHVYPKDINAFEVKLLNETDLTEFDKLVTPLFCEIKRNKHEINVLNKMNRILISKL